jgi:multiple sugar transport system substrate-binding protein
MICPIGFVPEYAQNEWLEPLTPWINDPTKAIPGYDFEDFFASFKDFIKPDGKTTYSLPITAEAQVLFYRKDLFKAAGLQPPKTMDELYEVAVKLTKGDVFGITLRGRIDSNWWPFQGFLASYGGGWIDPANDNKILINSPESIAAFDMYSKLVLDAGSKGTSDFCFDEIGNEFASGKAAMYLDSSVALPRFSNSEKSVIQNKFATAIMPAGPAGSIPDVHAWGIGMNPKSKNKDASWLFMQWATSKEMQKQLFLKGVPAPRTSTWNVAEVKSTLPADFVEALKVSFDNGSHGPLTPLFAKLQHILTIETQSAITGQKTAEKASNDTAKQWEDMLKEVSDASKVQ